MQEVRIDSSLSKADRYGEMTQSLASLLDGEPDALANLSNAAALIAQSLDRIEVACRARPVHAQLVHRCKLQDGGTHPAGPAGGTPTAGTADAPEEARA